MEAADEADKDVCVLIPTLDEAATIGDVVSGFQEEGFRNILVIDGGSTDGTREIAADAGVRVEVQTGSGKGQAVREALTLIDAPYVLMADGDGTYRPEDASQMLEPIRQGQADHVIGNRFAEMEANAMTRLNRVGNHLINRAFHVIHGLDLKDILSGYRAFTRESANRLRLTAGGFGIETEFAVECVKHGIEMTVVPITYRARPAESDPNLNPIRDGGIILVTLYRLAKTTNPLFYFGSAGAGTILFAFLVGGFVIIEWVTRGISHEILAILASFALLVGVQLVMVGILTDMIIALHHEQLREFE